MDSTNLIKNFTCEICEQAFSTNNYKKQHISNVHEELKKFICNICSKSFGSKHVAWSGAFLNVPCLHYAVLSPKCIRPDLVLTRLVGYLDMIGSPLDDGCPQRASSAPPAANLGV